MKGMIGRLALIASGGGGLVLLAFVALPWLTGAPPPEEVPGASMSAGEPEAGAAPERSHVVGVRNTGEEVAVVFPSAEEAAPGGGTIAGREGSGPEEERELPADAVEILPPVLSPEEVAAAMDGLDEGVEDATMLPEVSGDERSARQGDSSAVEEAAAEMRTEAVERRLAEAMRPGDSGRDDQVRVMPPPLSATRDVQELLAALGYEPGPVDGIWGERTEGAWRRFARDAVNRAGRTELAEAPDELGETEPAIAGEPSAAESPTPSGAAVESEGTWTGQAGDGHRQAGDGHRQAGLPPESVPEPEVVAEPGAAGEAKKNPQPVVVPETLRGVMGYRMPLVSRQGVPDQVVSGVLIPAHTAFVIVKPGYWELVGLEPGEVERLRGPAKREAEPVRRGWNPFRLFRKRRAPAEGNGP